MKHVALYVCALLSLTSAQAANFTVTNLNDNGAGSLRDAIIQANVNPGADTIDFAVTGTIVLTGGQLQIDGPLSINGPGAANLIIDANLASRAIIIIEFANPGCPALSGPSDYHVTLSGMTVRKGRRMTDNSAGGIFSAKSLTLSGMLIEDNQAKNGGGVTFLLQHPGQSLTISNSEFRNNIAKPLSVITGASNSGGGLNITENCPNTRTMPAAVMITGSLFTDNHVQPVALSGRGGAIGSFSDADITITDTRIVGNGVEAPAIIPGGVEYTGGAFNGRAGALRIERSEISDNAVISNNATASGGGLAVSNNLLARQTPADVMPVTIVDSTISGNVTTASAGALNVFGNVALVIQNSTIAGNVVEAARTAGIRMSTGATDPPSASNALAPSLALASTIIGHNLAGTLDIATNTAVMPTTTINATRSLVESPCQNCGLTFSGSGNLIGADPGLAPLAFNGGPTRTHALLPTSLAINTGANPLGLTTDQRGAGFPRVLGTSADMGAYEYPASCAGFTDIASGDGFCPNVEWMRNRAITLGCVVGVYCAGNDVLRVQMAAFMNRLGNDLTAAVTYVQSSSGAIVLPGPPPAVAERRCFAPVAEATNYPRRAVVTASLSALADANAAALRAALVVSYDGVNWDNFAPGTSTGIRTTSQANQWSSGKLVESLDLAPGVAPVFAINIRRDDATATTGNMADSRCQIDVTVHNRNGTSSPY
jgi:hypothetical protein